MATRSTHRHVGRWLLGALLVVLAAVAICEWLEWPFARGPLERALQRGLMRDVAIGEDFGLRLFGSVRLRTDSLRIDGPRQGPNPPERDGAPQFMNASGVVLALPYGTVAALLGGKPAGEMHVRSLDVARLDLALVRDAGGAANWQFGDRQKKPEPRAGMPSFDRLVVQNARLWLDDAATDLVLQATLQTNEGVAVADARDKGLQARASGSFRKLPLSAQLRTSGLLPLAAGANAPNVPVQLSLQVEKNELHLDGQVRDLLKLSALDAEFRLSGTSLGAVGDPFGIALPTTPPFQTQGRVRKNGAVWDASVARFQVGTSRLSGEFRYDAGAAPPHLSGSLRGARLALSDLGPAVTSIGPVEKKHPPDKSQRGVLPQQEFNLPALDAMQAEVLLELERFDLGTPRLAPFAPLRARVVLANRVLSVEDLRASSAGGELRGKASLDARQPVPLWRSDLQWSGIRLERFLSARNPRAKTAEQGKAPPGYLSGLLGGSARLQGSGRSTGAMLASLDGAVELWVRDGTVSALLIELIGLDLVESLGVALAGDSALPLNCAVARFVLEDGVARPEVALIDTPDSTLLVSGQVSLVTEQLDLTVQTKPKDFSLVSLRGPLHVEGSFEEPDLRFEAGAIGLRAAAGIALGALVAPLAGLIAFIDLGEPEAPVCQDALQNLRNVAKPAPARKR